MGANEKQTTMFLWGTNDDEIMDATYKAPDYPLTLVPARLHGYSVGRPRMHSRPSDSDALTPKPILFHTGRQTDVVDGFLAVDLDEVEIARLREHFADRAVPGFEHHTCTVEIATSVVGRK